MKLNKDTLTTILGLGIAGATAAQPILSASSGAFKSQDWISLISAVLMAVFGYLTNKDK